MTDQFDIESLSFVFKCPQCKETEFLSRIVNLKTKTEAFLCSNCSISMGSHCLIKEPASASKQEGGL